MKNFNLNVKKFVTRGALTFVLLSTPATLGGCGKNEEKEDPTYVWADNFGIVEYTEGTKKDDELTPIYYINNEGFLSVCYVDEQDIDNYICVDSEDKTVYDTVDTKVIEKFIKKKGLIDIDANLDMLLDETKDNKIAFAREKMFNDKTGEEEYTGRIFLVIHYYQTYRIVIGNNGKPKLEEGPVLLDFKNFDNIDNEYPYVKEDYDQTYSFDITKYKEVLVNLDDTAVDIDTKSLGLILPF